MFLFPSILFFNFFPIRFCVKLRIERKKAVKTTTLDSFLRVSILNHYSPCWRVSKKIKELVWIMSEVAGTGQVQCFTQRQGNSEFIVREGRCGGGKQAVSQNALVHSRPPLNTPAGNCSVNFYHLGFQKCFRDLQTTLHWKPLREFGRTHIKAWGKGLNWPQGRTYNNQFLFWLFYS